MISRENLQDHWVFIPFLSGLVALAPLAIDMYMPAMPAMAAAFGVSFSDVNLTMSAYMLGNAFGQFFGGSLSDQIGRKKIGIIGLLVFMVATLCIIFSPTIEVMQGLRIVQAVGGGFATVICIAQVRDIFPTDQVMKRYANVVLVMLFAPIIAPSIGVLLIQFGWQSIFIFLALVSVLMLLLYIFLIPETRATVSGEINLGRMFAGYWAVLSHRVDGRITAIRYALFSAFSAGVLMCFITNVSMIFINHFQFSPQQFGFGFASLGLSMIAGNRLSIRIANRMPAETWLRYATVIQLICLCVLVVLSLNALATPILVACLILLVICMTGSIMPTASGRYITFFDEHAGSAASLATTLVFALGAVIGAAAAVLSRGSITPVFIAMAISCAIGLLILTTIDTRHSVSFRG